MKFQGSEIVRAQASAIEEGRLTNSSSRRGEVATGFLRRAEKLARTLLSGKYDGAETIWKLQTDLLRLQRDIQEAIAEEKNRPRRQQDRESLDRLRACRWHARRLGDAVAWLLLGLDKRVITPLSRNQHVPIGEENHGSRGLEVISAHLANEGWGFPVLHDVTDCLRIGDVTFVSGLKESERMTRTVEVKTRLVREEAVGEDQRFEYSVSLLSVADPPVEPPVTEKQDEAPLHPAVSPDSRARRQLQRMARAQAHVDARDGELVPIDGEPPLLTVKMDSEAASHWKTVRRVIRESRQAGYASAAVEDAFLYVALYNADGVGTDDIEATPLPADVVNSGILPSSQPDRDGLIINMVPPVGDRGPHVSLPYFLYSIPMRAIFEILHQKLIVFVLVNPGRVLEALEREGFEAWTEQAPRGRTFGSIVARTDVLGPDGGRYSVELHNLDHHMRELIHEFKSLDHLVDVARETCEGSATSLRQIRAFAEGKAIDDAS